MAKGKDHAIPDALSRAPVNDPEPDDDETNKDVQLFSRQVMLRRIAAVGAVTPTTEDEEEITDDPNHLVDPVLEKLKITASNDASYSALIQAIETGFTTRRDLMAPAVHQFWKIRDELSVDDGLVLFGCRIVIPQSSRRDILLNLHAAHQGIVRMKRRARQTVYWPGLSNDIVAFVDSCQVCQELQPSQQQEPLLRDALPERVFEEVSTDLFKSGRLHVLVPIRMAGDPPMVSCPFSQRIDSSDHRKFC
jgi:hypothetical protein